MGKRKGRSVRKNPISKETLEPENLVKAPHSFVIHRGHCSKELMDLTKDFRKIMEPFTASQLKERKKNTLKDFVSISGYLHVSHMMIFTETELGTYMRLARLPQGPTLTFRIHNYSLARDVISSLRKQYVMMKAFQNAPLIVLNSFSGEGMHMKLMATMFQNMFPTINITTVKLKNIRRCVLMNYNPATKLIELRHYVIRASPVGLNRGTKKMVQGKIPNLNRCKDMSEFFDKAGLLSESEFEDDPNSQIILPQNLATRGAAAESKSAIRLFELGPRISMQLIKVEDGFMDGEVLYHELVEKTEEEKALIKKKREEKKRQKEKRKAQQEENIKRKVREKEELKQKSMEGIKKKKESTESQRLMELAAAESQDAEVADDEDDDADYYRQEVGEEPEKDLFTKHPNRKRKTDDNEPRGFKKMRLDNKLKKKFHKSQDTTGRVQNTDGKRRFQNNQDGGRKFQGRDGGKKFQGRDGGNKFQGRDGGNKFQGRDGGNKFQGRDGGKKFQGREGGKFQNKDGGRKFQGGDGGRNFKGKDGGGRNFKGGDGGGRNFKGREGGGKFQNKEGGRGKFNRNSDNQDRGFNKGKKVFGGKINKGGKNQGRPGSGGKSKGKGRK